MPIVGDMFMALEKPHASIFKTQNWEIKPPNEFGLYGVLYKGQVEIFYQQKRYALLFIMDHAPDEFLTTVEQLMDASNEYKDT